MVDLNVEIYNALKGICRVSPEFPTADDDFPAVTYSELSNIDEYSIEGRERLSDITYQIDVWDNGDSRQECERISNEVSHIMTAKGFKRIFGKGFRDSSGLHRKMMYFKTIVIN